MPEKKRKTAEVRGVSPVSGIDNSKQVAQLS